jgi:hypothetical protein
VPADVEASERDVTTAPPAVSGLPLGILRSEGVVLLVAALAVYFAGLDEPWWLVPLLLFVPDVFIGRIGH